MKHFTDLNLWRCSFRNLLRSRPLNASVVREACFPFGVETKIAGGTRSHVTGPGGACCKLLVKTYGNPSSRAACNGCLDGDGLGQFGYHPQALWLSCVSWSKHEKPKRISGHQDYSQSRISTLESFIRTIDSIESFKSSHRIIDLMKNSMLCHLPLKVLKSLAWVPESCDVLFVVSLKIPLLSAFWNTRRISLNSFVGPGTCCYIQLPGGSWRICREGILEKCMLNCLTV